MSDLDSGQQSPEGGDNQSTATTKPVKKKFLNGWTKELEGLIADWADKAACYRWMHGKTSVIYARRDRFFNIPIIILSGVTAGANFALGSIFEPTDVENKKWAQLGLGGASLVTGIVQTLMNFYRYAQLSEAHRVAGVSWGKFNRLLCIEMNLHPDERMEAFNFLKMFRTELDRLIEQSPEIPEQVVKDFNSIFKNTPEVVKPEITGILNHTRIFVDTNSRLKRIAAEATIALHYKRGVIKQLVQDELEVKTRTLAIEAAREVAKEVLDQQKAVIAAAAAAKLPAKPVETRRVSIATKQAEERKVELAAISAQKAGTVRELRERFRLSKTQIQSPVQLPGTPVAGPAENILVPIPEVSPTQEQASPQPAETVIEIADDIPEEEKAQFKTPEYTSVPTSEEASANEENV